MRQLTDTRTPSTPRVVRVNYPTPYSDLDHVDIWLDERASTQDGTLGPLGEVLD